MNLSALGEAIQFGRLSSIRWFPGGNLWIRVVEPTVQIKRNTVYTQYHVLLVTAMSIIDLGVGATI